MATPAALPHHPRRDHSPHAVVGAAFRPPHHEPCPRVVAFESGIQGAFQKSFVLISTDSCAFSISPSITTTLCLSSLQRVYVPQQFRHEHGSSRGSFESLERWGPLVAVRRVRGDIHGPRGNEPRRGGGGGEFWKRNCLRGGGVFRLKYHARNRRCGERLCRYRTRGNRQWPQRRTRFHQARRARFPDATRYAVCLRQTYPFPRIFQHLR